MIEVQGLRKTFVQGRGKQRREVAAGDDDLFRACVEPPISAIPGSRVGTTRSRWSTR